MGDNCRQNSTLTTSKARRKGPPPNVLPHHRNARAITLHVLAGGGSDVSPSIVAMYPPVTLAQLNLFPHNARRILRIPRNSRILSQT